MKLNLSGSGHFMTGTVLRITLFLSIFSYPCVYAQEQPEFKTEVPPSPNSAAFMRYGDYPVVLNTGTIPISIPLYEINTGKIRVPITLSYHAAGIQVGQIPSSVGLGWTLNAGGVISRVMRGLPDEKSQTGYFDLAATMKLASQYTDDQQDREYLSQLLGGAVDGSPDKFNISAPGISAQFMYSNALTPLISPYQELKIEGGLPVNQGYYLVENTDGTIFRFGESITSVNTKEISSSHVKGPDPDPYVSSWYLTEIISADYTDTVYFEYDTHDINQYSVSRSQQYDHAFGYNGILPDGDAHDEYIAEFGHASNLISTSNFHELSPINVTTQEIGDARNIKRIRFRGGKVEFTNAPSYGGSLRRVSEIIIYEDIGSEAETKRFAFEYGAFNDPASRLKLVNVREGKGSEFLPPYEFHYNEQYSMPGYDSPNCDLWGYYNGASNTMFVPAHTVNGLTYGSADRDVHAAYMGTYMLNQIHYPTGGSSTFEFEPHAIDATVIGGGLRIKEIVNKDHNGMTTSRKQYSYDDEYWVASTMKSSFQVPHSVTEHYVYYVVGIPYEANYSWEYTTSHYNSSYYNAPGGSPVGYGRVIEYLGDENDNVGRTDYLYWGSQDYGQTYDYPFPQLHDNSEIRSKLLKKSHFRALGGGQYKKVHETTNTYTLHQIATASGLKVKWLLEPHKLAKVFFEATADPHPNPISAWLTIYDEFQHINFIQLDNTTETDSTLTHTTVYEYDNKPSHFQVTSVQSTNSNGQVSLKNFRYSTDQSEITGLTIDEQDALAEMEARNMIDIPVETEVTTDGSMISKTTTTYQESGAAVLPKSVVTEFPGNDKVRVGLSFNDKGKLIEAKPENEPCDAQIWDFFSSKPVAFVKGACTDQIAYSGFETTDNGYWDFHKGETTQPLGINLSIANPAVSFVTNASQNFNYAYSMTKTVGPSPELHFVGAGGANYIHYLQQTSGNESVTLPAGDWQVSIVSYPNVSAASASMTVTEYIMGDIVYNTDQASGLRSVELQPLNTIERLMQKNGKYTVAFAFKGGQVNVNITNGSILDSSEFDLLNSWKLKTIRFEVSQPNANLELSGSGLLDELRLHPVDAQMTTVSYGPGVVTSSTDANNVSTFYEYDMLGRLKVVKDQHGNVVKGHDYNYK